MRHTVLLVVNMSTLCPSINQIRNILRLYTLAAVTTFLSICRLHIFSSNTSRKRLLYTFELSVNSTLSLSSVCSLHGLACTG